MVDLKPKGRCVNKAFDSDVIAPQHVACSQCCPLPFSAPGEYENQQIFPVISDKKDSNQEENNSLDCASNLILYSTPTYPAAAVPAEVSGGSLASPGSS